jgi:ATP-dependent Zn protease
MNWRRCSSRWSNMAKGASIAEVRKKVTKTYELITTSYHEAGHTIYALLHYMKVNYVYVFEHKIFKRIHGFTQYESHDFDKDNVDFIPMLEQEIGLSYAGLLAEKLHFKSISGTDQVPMFIKEGSSDDLSAIRKMLQKYNIVPAGKKRYAYKQKVARKTTTILMEHWDAIDVIAHALFKHKRLSYQDLKQLLTTKTKDKKFWREKFKDIESIFPL